MPPLPRAPFGRPGDLPRRPRRATRLGMARFAARRRRELALLGRQRVSAVLSQAQALDAAKSVIAVRAFPGNGDNIRVAVEFLKNFRPSGPWLVFEIDPNAARAAPKPHEFDEEADLVRYLSCNSGRVNLYFVPNYAERGLVKTPTKEQITHLT